jgi:hypothetical protein
MKNTINLLHWNDYKVVLSSNILSNIYISISISLEYALSKFWNELIINIDLNKLVLIQFLILDMNNNLDYVGNVPEFKYFNGLQIFQYIKYKN